MQRYFDSVQNTSGDSVSGASIAVYNAQGALATLYSDNGVTPLANPLTSDGTGQYAFYAANGTYSTTTTAAGLIAKTEPGIVLYDPKDAGRFSVSDFAGVDPTGLTDSSTGLINAFTYASSIGAKCLVPAGTYLISHTVTWPITVGFDLECATGAVFLGSSAMPVDNKLFQPTAPAGMIRFRWVGGMIDGRSLPPRNVGAPDMMYIAGPNLANVEIEGVYFIVNNARGGTAGDSCLFLSEAENYRILNNTFQGASDSGCYVSGNTAQTTGRKALISGNLFYECDTGFISKRSFEDNLVEGNFVVQCNNGIVIGGEADTTLLPGKKGVVMGNNLRRCQIPIAIRISDNTLVIGNRIENHGITSAGTNVAVPAIALQGSKRCLISGNHISSPDVTQVSGSSGVLLDQRIWNSITYTSDDNLVEGNFINDMVVGVKEISGAVNRNYIGATNKYLNCATTVAATAGARIGLVVENPASLYFNLPSAATDQKLWKITQTATTLTLATRTDVDGPGNNVFQATRSGAVLTQLVMQIGMFGNYANDAAAATGGVAVGGLYRNGSALMIRVS